MARSIASYRAEYRALRARALELGISREDFNRRVDQAANKIKRKGTPAPVTWVRAARTVVRGGADWGKGVEASPVAAASTVDCPACNGSGRYPLRNGGSGMCYRCRGTGRQTPEDRRRNSWYDALNR